MKLSWFHKCFGIVPSHVPSHPHSCATCSTSSEKLLLSGEEGEGAEARGLWKGLGPRSPVWLGPDQLLQETLQPVAPAGRRETHWPPRASPGFLPPLGDRPGTPLSRRPGDGPER